MGTPAGAQPHCVDPPWRTASLWGCLLVPSLTVGTPTGLNGVLVRKSTGCRGLGGVVWASPCSADWLYPWVMMAHPLWSVSLAVGLAAEASRYLPALCLWEPSDSHIL